MCMPYARHMHARHSRPTIHACHAHHMHAICTCTPYARHMHTKRSRPTIHACHARHMHMHTHATCTPYARHMHTICTPGARGPLAVHSLLRDETHAPPRAAGAPPPLARDGRLPQQARHRRPSLRRQGRQGQGPPPVTPAQPRRVAGSRWEARGKPVGWPCGRIASVLW